MESYKPTEFPDDGRFLIFNQFDRYQNKTIYANDFLAFVR